MMEVVEVATHGDGEGKIAPLTGFVRSRSAGQFSEKKEVTETQFASDANGDIVTRPLLGGTIVPVASMAILVQLQYAETPQELQTGGQKLQLVLTPQQAQGLAAVLTRQAAHILAQRPDGPAS